MLEGARHPEWWRLAPGNTINLGNAIQRHPLTSQNAGSDPLDRLQDDVVIELGGKPTSAHGGGTGIYVSTSTSVTTNVNGIRRPHTDELRQQIARAQEHHEDLKHRQQRRQALVQMRKVRGVPQVDAASGKVIQAHATSIVFRLRGIPLLAKRKRLAGCLRGPRKSDGISTERSNCRNLTRMTR